MLLEGDRGVDRPGHDLRDGRRHLVTVNLVFSGQAREHMPDLNTVFTRRLRDHPLGNLCRSEGPREVRDVHLERERHPLRELLGR